MTTAAQMDDLAFYVYVHKKPCGEVFYVGKGSGQRAGSTRYRNVRWQRVVAKYGYEIEILKSQMTEPEAFSEERRLISHYGRKNLANFTDGGEGVSGWKHSEKTRALISKLNIGRTASTETRKKMSEAHKKIPSRFIGRKYSLEHRAAIGASISGSANGRYDAVKYKFCHPQHGSLTATKWEMRQKFGLHHSALHRVATGSAKHTAGWHIEHS